MNLQSPCACGGLIVAGASWAIREAVDRHNATPRHLAWRRTHDKVIANAIRRERTRQQLHDMRLLRSIRDEVAA